MENELSDNKNELKVVDGVYVPQMPETTEIPIIENPDDREYEKVEIEVEGGR